VSVGDVWRRYPDTHEVAARFPGRCLGCQAPISIGDTIVGTRHGGWVCVACSSSFGATPDPVPWALPVGARSLPLQFAARCCHCQAELVTGSEAWPNVMGGWSCPGCRSSVPPTWWGVLVKAADRIAKGLPINLTLADYEALRAVVEERTSLVPARQGGQREWSEARRERDRIALISGWPPPNARDTYGLLEDAIEHRFNPNLSTDQFLQLARAVEDPDSADPHWDAAFRRRALLAPVRGADAPDG
jgi:hypothetical protein